MDVRDATLHDIPSITSIYNDAIARTTAVWSEATVDVDERLRWLRQRAASGYPVIVAEDEGIVIGYASFGDFRPWPGYRRTVELSVYVAAEHRRRGAGRALLAELLRRARELGKAIVVAGIESSNHASLALHASLGFFEAGRLPRVGEKFGRSLDLVLLCCEVDGPARRPLD
jgi:L-amino acid N-acyltransferase